MANLNIPPSNSVVRLRAIDAETQMCVSSKGFIQPTLRGFEILNLTSITFLVEHPQLHKKVLFDCGARKDFENFSPRIKERLNLNVKGLRIEKDVHDIVQEAGVPLDELDAMIWSHWHWDHHGAPEKYPQHVEVVVGQGFKENFMPGYPTLPNAIFLDANFEGRAVREINFSDEFKIGNFRAHDYFGDGSFYLLDTPGHAIGHMCGLARTTPATFVFLGGDICHFGGSFRPSSKIALPNQVPNEHLDSHLPHPCPCSMFTEVHPAGSSSPASQTSPFFEVTSFAQSAYLNREEAARSIRELQRFDEHPDILVCIAHDPTLIKVLPFLNNQPEKDLKDWKERGLKQKAQWGWLNELPRNGKPGREMYVEGVWKEGEMVEDFTKLKATIY
ncbi:Metallo-hydrolase/oxidoreductase [Cucurbitaria berberidis CBS 394.84]|uniref:Metallo-hydrolase/oxidoreductase n=1 Tax=Cucurbitaria berberidis CBS 394.84 TaxID=1168544 RepID=A0A9P4LC29_9PLEO|nr:Metallo-hydrolase/oxidoreductase [Cucurbitaria berberidis CBS 394.84]KAF1849263.1 Metallo-hydrolase/oxidoreductase [Cucurbitaria berberidis CBS 394.84]